MGHPVICDTVGCLRMEGMPVNVTWGEQGCPGHRTRACATLMTVSCRQDLTCCYEPRLYVKFAVSSVPVPVMRQVHHTFPKQKVPGRNARFQRRCTC